MLLKLGGRRAVRRCGSGQSQPLLEGGVGPKARRPQSRASGAGDQRSVWPGCVTPSLVVTAAGAGRDSPGFGGCFEVSFFSTGVKPKTPGR